MPTTSHTAARSFADAVGIVASLACALHCVAVPLALVAGPLGSLPMASDDVFHQLLLWVVVPSAAIAFSMGCRRHRDRLVLWMGIAGLVSLIAAFTVVHELAGENGERLLATVAAGLLVTAHVRNFRLCRSDACQHDPA